MTNSRCAPNGVPDRRKARPSSPAPAECLIRFAAEDPAHVGQPRWKTKNMTAK